MARILFCQPNLQPPGGGQAVAAHMLQALLQHGHEVTLLTVTPCDPGAIDRHFGTSLAALMRGHPRVIAPSLPSLVLDRLSRVGVSIDLVRTAVLLRECRRHEGDYDLVVSAHNEWPMRGPCVSYVHYPSRARPRPAADLRWFHIDPVLRVYYGLADRLADFTADDVRRQHLLTNSRWTADVLARTWGVQATVLPPIVTVDDDSEGGRDIPFEARDPVFVCAGRFSSTKRHGDVIAIVRGLRARGHDVRLRFVGSGGDADVAKLRAIAAREGFIDVESGLDRKAYLRRLRNSRFGLHAMHEEHFGIAPAELTEAGVITWGHKSGGLPEILVDDDLLFTDVEDAIARIDAVLRDEARLTHHRQQLAARRGRYGADRFARTFLDVVDRALTGPPLPRG